MNLTKGQVRRLQKKLRPINSIIPNLNHGGCGFFAYFLSKELTRYDIKHRILLDADTSRNVKEWNEGKIKHCHEVVTGFFYSHLLLNFDAHRDWGLDSSRVWSINHSKRQRYLVNIDANILRLMLKDRDHWNDEFDRKYSLRMARFIRKAVKEFIDDERTRTTM